MPRLYRDSYLATADLIVSKIDRPVPDVELNTILLAFQDVLRRADKFSHHQIQREPLSVRERMSTILLMLEGSAQELLGFHSFFTVEEGKGGAVVTFLAILELSKEGLIDIIQGEPMSDVWLKPIID